MELGSGLKRILLYHFQLWIDRIFVSYHSQDSRFHLFLPSRHLRSRDRSKHRVLDRLVRVSEATDDHRHSISSTTLNTPSNPSASTTTMGSIPITANATTEPFSLPSALAAAEEKYTSTHPISHATHLAATKHLPGGNTRTVLHTPPFPLTFSRGEGATLYPCDLDDPASSSSSTSTSATNNDTSEAATTTSPAKPLTDFLSEYTAAIFGHSHPTIASALQTAVSKGWNYGGHNGLEGTLASMISERFPAMEMLRFVNSGTEANLLALATARAVTSDRDRDRGVVGDNDRRTIIVFERGYHGSVISGRAGSVNSSSSSSSSSNSSATSAVAAADKGVQSEVSASEASSRPTAPGQGAEQESPAVQRQRQQQQQRQQHQRKTNGGHHHHHQHQHHEAATTNTPKSRGKLSLNLPYDFRVAPYNDIPALQKLAKEIGPGNLAAVLVEPMLGSGGCFPATKPFLLACRDVADQLGGLLVVDEVMTSRLASGGLFSAIVNDEEVKPDLMTLGKYIGGGMSFGAFGGRKEEIMELFNPGTGTGRLEHPGTFNNNVFTMHAGIAGLEVLTPSVLAELNARGDRLRHALDEVLRRYGLGGSTAYDNASSSSSTTTTTTNTAQGKAMREVRKATAGDDGHGLPIRPLSEAEHEDPEVYKAYPRVFVKGRGSLLTMHFLGPEREGWQRLWWLGMVERGWWVAGRGFVALNVMLGGEDVQGFVEGVEGWLSDKAEALQW